MNNFSQLMKVEGCRTFKEVKEMEWDRVECTLPQTSLRTMMMIKNNILFYILIVYKSV